MSRWLDFRALKAQVSLRDVLARYGFLEGLRESKHGKLVGPCPIHGGTGRQSFHADLEKNIFNCFSTCGGGNVLDLVMKVENVDVRAAGELLAEWFDVQHTPDGESRRSATVRGKTPDKPANEAPELTRTAAQDEAANPALNRRLRLDHNHPYLAERFLNGATVTHFGVGYCNRGIMRGRIAIPIHDENDQLVAYAGRAVTEELADEKGKYRLPEGFRKALVLWNLNRAREHAGGGLIVVEGFFGAMKVHQAGYPNVVALMGSSLSDRQEQLLLSHTDRLTLMFDGDDAGRACLRDFYRRLRRRLFLREVYVGDNRQPDRLELSEIRALLEVPGA